MTFNQRVAVITGTSSGMGYEISLVLARSGTRNGFMFCNFEKYN
jgi:NAD(P)-dependent dehydrogenase (short-subunit alcohol dehydrogenase family)